MYRLVFSWEMSFRTDDPVELEFHWRDPDGDASGIRTQVPVETAEKYYAADCPTLGTSGFWRVISSTRSNLDSEGSLQSHRLSTVDNLRQSSYCPTFMQVRWPRRKL